jgi:hypothetical protein
MQVTEKQYLPFSFACFPDLQNTKKKLSARTERSLGNCTEVCKSSLALPLLRKDELEELLRVRELLF